jgi:hypothetical protein
MYISFGEDIGMTPQTKRCYGSGQAGKNLAGGIDLMTRRTFRPGKFVGIFLHGIHNEQDQQ